MMMCSMDEFRVIVHELIRLKVVAMVLSSVLSC